MQNDSPGAPRPFDPTRRFIRIRQQRDDGFVEFDFAVGDAELSVELILPRPAFEAFARLPGTERMSEDAAALARRRQHAYLFGQPDDGAAHLHDNNQET